MTRRIRYRRLVAALTAAWSLATVNVAAEETDDMPNDPLFAHAGFDKDSFDAYLDMRAGADGETVYWYGFGVVNRFPDGKELARVEGVDVGKLVRPDPDAPEAFQLSRKFIVFRDPETGELMRDETGKVRFIGYTYQYFKYMLEGDRMLYEIEQGAGDQMLTVTGGAESEVRTMGPLTIVTTPVWVNAPIAQHWEKYDFLIPTAGTDAPKYQLVWSRYGGNFSWMGGGFNTMHMWSYRYDTYEDMPQTLRTVIEEEPGMELWREPPQDVEEIRALQQPGAANFR